MSLPDPSPTSYVAVTGAASGIGAALACELARLGHDVLAIDVDGERLDVVASEVAGQYGTRVDAHTCDLTTDRQRRLLIQRINADARDLVGLCNNAGMWSGGPFHQLAYDRERRIVGVNVVAVHHLTAALLPGMVARGSGAILNTASVGANAPTPMSLTYGATKAFVHSFSEGLHAELSGTGVSCTSLQPGMTNTALASSAPGGERLEQQQRLRGVPFAQSPEQVAKAAVSGMRRGSRVVVPSQGWRYVGGPLTRHAPRALLLPAIRMAVGRATQPKEG